MKRLGREYSAQGSPGQASPRSLHFLKRGSHLLRRAGGWQFNFQCVTAYEPRAFSWVTSAYGRSEKELPEWQRVRDPLAGSTQLGKGVLTLVRASCAVLSALPWASSAPGGWPPMVTANSQLSKIQIIPLHSTNGLGTRSCAITQLGLPGKMTVKDCCVHLWGSIC